MVRGIVLVVLDCVRADHLSCYGYGRETTPTIDALARRGLTWEHAYSTCSWTKPSVASILTGLYPSQHGVLRGPKRLRGRTGCVTDALPGDCPHVAGEFARTGRQCAAFLNNVQLENYTGFNRGFSTYVADCRGADRQLKALDDWLATGHADDRFFAYLHLMEAHWPYKPRRRHVALFGGDRNTSAFAAYSARDFSRLRRALARGEVTLSAGEREDLIRMYDAAVRRLDGKIKLLLRILENRGVRDTTAVVITADHGEELFDHGGIGHGHSLHVETTHVPLIVSNPIEPACGRRAEPVSLVDLPHTLLRLGGVGTVFPGRDVISAGTSASAAYGELSIGRRCLRAIRVGDRRLHRESTFPRDHDLSPLEFLRGAYRGDTSGHETVRLYDLAADPGERKDLAGDPAEASVIECMTKEMEAAAGPRAGAVQSAARREVDADEVLVDRLRALGYIE
ncbi:MAG: sulfatase [Phycisphaerales bacterium]|nr:sulfatase [Phycisphaerales bacterium]